MKKNSVKHGGNLIRIIKEKKLSFDRLDDWLDLSTGISPFGYPIPEVAANAYRELPQFDGEFRKAVEKYYGSQDFLTIAGSQAVIKQLPKFINSASNCSRVFIPEVGYKEHLSAWSESAKKVVLYRELPSIDSLKKEDVLVVINPNNPSGAVYSKQQLYQYWEVLHTLNGYLIVDEAFIDALEENHSVIKANMPDSLVVFRSIGKFFGLAGIRIGFVFAQQKLLNELEIELGPWTVNGPALEIAKHALANKAWHKKQSQRLEDASDNLNKLLMSYFPDSAIAGCSLFTTLYHEYAEDLFERLLEYQVYVRLCDEGDSVRFGVPNSDGLKRLNQVLRQLYPEDKTNERQ